MSATSKATSSASGKAIKKKAKKATAKKQSPQQKAVRARWDAQAETDEQVREYFLNCEHGDGIEGLKTLRRQLEIAARAYDENVHRDTQEKCANPDCGRPLGQNSPPYHKMPVKDPLTNITRNVMTCSQPCYLIVHGKSGDHPIGRKG